MVQTPSAARRPAVLRNDYLDSEVALSLDRSGMLDHAAALGLDLATGCRSFAAPRMPPPAGGWQAVVVAGVGGSAAAGDYLAAYVARQSTTPVIVNRGMDLPAFVGPPTPVICCSYSGNTEEALNCYAQARAAGAPLLAVRSGGELDRRAAADGVDGIRIEGGRAPRAALGLMFGAVLRAAQGLGIIEETDVAEAAAAHHGLVRDRLGPLTPSSQNPAKAMAQAIRSRTVFLMAAEHLTAPADRFKNQLAENGKAMAMSMTIPEAAHNLVAALETASDQSDRIAIVTLESRRHYRAEISARFDAVVDAFAAEGVPVHRIRLAARTRLADLLEATAWGDFVSCYVGLLNGKDPTPIAPISRIKEAVQNGTTGWPLRPTPDGRNV